MEESVPDLAYDRVQHFISDSSWDHRLVMDRIAEQASDLIGGSDDSCLLLDETSFLKKGHSSAGVSRQWSGRYGKIDNCQVGVFAVLGCGRHAIPIDAKLYLPGEWAADPIRCQRAKIPVEERVSQTKQLMALEMIKRARAKNVQFNWIAADGLYGCDTKLLQAIDQLGECFVIDVHCNQRIFTKDPQPAIPPSPANGRPRTVKRSDATSVQLDELIAAQPEKAWRKVTVRSATKGPLVVEALKIPVWVWPQKHGRETCSHWMAIVTRDPDTKKDIKYALTNMPSKTSVRRLAFMQRQRFWIEHAFKEAKSTCGMADYQVRSWVGWHHHIALVMLVQLFMTAERIEAPEDLVDLSANDIRDILVTFLPQKPRSAEELAERIGARIRKRKAAEASCYARAETG